MGQTEENIKIESDTFALKRDYKYALENVTAIKKEVAELMSIKDKLVEDIDTKQEELTKVINDISQEKLDWASFRHSELVELENKQSEANNVLKRKAELNEQEETIRQIEAKNTDILNETRRLELKVKGDITSVESKENQLKIDITTFEEEKLKLIKDKENFKKRVEKVLKEVNEL